MSNCSASCTSVRSPLFAAIATFALKADVWFRRGLLLMLSPDSRAKSCPLSGRSSTYRPVQILESGSTCIKRAMHGYPTQQAAANAGEKALRRFLESEALKQEQGIMADKHSKPPEPPNDNAKSIDRWDDEGGAPSGGRSVRKRPSRARAKRSSCA